MWAKLLWNRALRIIFRPKKGGFKRRMEIISKFRFSRFVFLTKCYSGIWASYGKS
jgi:hypothetical protein